jgi:hypothetical protein
MANYLPPTENLPIFDNSVFTSNDAVLTESVAAKTYLKFPTAQGDETLQGITVAGDSSFIGDATLQKMTVEGESTFTDYATFELRTFLDGGADVGDTLDVGNTINAGTNIVMSGTPDTNYLEFPDGTKQYTASSGVITGNLTLPANLIFSAANSYIQFADNTKQYTAAAGSTVFYNEVLYIYRSSMTVGSLDSYCLNFNVPRTYSMGTGAGTPTGYNLLLIGGGGGRGSNVNNPTSPVVGQTYTQRLGGSGGAGGVVSAAYRFTGTYSSGTSLFSLYSFPHYLPIGYNTSSPIFQGPCTTIANQSRLYLYGTGSALASYSAFVSAPIGSVIVCSNPSNTTRPWFLTAIVNAIVVVSPNLSAYYELGFTCDQTIAGTSGLVYSVYSSATNPAYQGTGLCTLPSSSNAFTITINSTTSGYSIPTVGDYFYAYKSTSANSAYGYVTGVSGSTVTITLPMNFGSSGNTNCPWYSFKCGYQGPSYYVELLQASALGQSSGIVGMAFGGSGGGNATSSAVGALGRAGYCISTNANNTTVTSTSGTSGSAGQQYASTYSVPYTAQQLQTIQATNSKISGTVEPTKQISSLPSGGWSLLTTSGVVQTAKGGYGGINIAYVG